MTDLCLAPLPRRVTPGRGTCPLPPGLEQELAGCTIGSAPPRGLAARVEHGLGPQAYRLAVEPGGLTVLGGDAAGLHYGLLTLRQLARGAAGSLPCLRIEDWPEFKVRGVLLDISRDRVPTMATLLRLIDLWAELKYNQVQLYTEHTFAYSAHQEVWRGASPLTAGEILELDRTCRNRGIELVPNQNSFGHMERWLRHPAYRHLADATEGFPEPTTLNPLDPGSLDLLGGLYDELLPLFSSRWFNIGADEPVDLGHGRSREACRSRGVGRVYLDFLLALHRQVAQRGRRLQFWGDVLVRHPELMREVPRDAVVLDWGYEQDHPFARECRLLAEAGLQYYVCPGTSAWNSVGGRWGNARANIRSAAREGLAAGAAGFLLADWGDNGHWQQLPVSLPAYVHAAAAAWNPGSEQGLDLERFLSRQVFRDPSGGAARALLALGEAGEASVESIARLPNATILAVLLLLPLQHCHRESLPKFRGYDFEPERERIARALRSLSAARPQADARLVEELEFTARLLEHAVRLGRERFATPNLEVGEIPSRTRKALAAELGELSGRYRELWLARSRPGGLEDSVGRMLALKDSYAGPD